MFVSTHCCFEIFDQPRLSTVICCLFCFWSKGSLDFESLFETRRTQRHVEILYETNPRTENIPFSLFRFPFFFHFWTTLLLLIFIGRFVFPVLVFRECCNFSTIWRSDTKWHCFTWLASYLSHRVSLSSSTFCLCSFYLTIEMKKYMFES